MQVDVPEYESKRTRTRTYDVKPDATATLRALTALICPAGTIIPTLVVAQPADGWLMCDGQAISKTLYPRLYTILGNRFGETATTFNLPDLRGRMPFGAGGALGLMAVGGAASVTLSVDQMPEHGHAVTDPGHGHAFTANPHSHTITDPGHIHTLTDPGHAHTSIIADAAESTTGADKASVTSGATASATTGITMASATTGITVNNATVNGSSDTATTGITIAETGSGLPVPILPPYIAVNWMVRT